MLYAMTAKYSFNLATVDDIKHTMRSFAHDFALLCGYTFFCVFARNFSCKFSDSAVRYQKISSRRNRVLKNASSKQSSSRFFSFTLGDFFIPF
jgi:hypothetical protein